ncbi:MAG: M28 family peptidase [Anaerolineales bacterium]|jgi:Zn-dependent M28 family amino/carboxypeptidase
MMVIRNNRISILVVLGVLFITLAVWEVLPLFYQPVLFSGQRAYQDVLAQVAFGPRVPDSFAHAETITYIQNELRKAGWQAQLQDTNWQGFGIQNIIASRSNQTPQIILGAHYDSRMLADQDPGPGRNAPVPGANDGASGVAVLLELARTLPKTSLPTWLVFFDAEDDGGIAGRDWIMGSQAFVAALTFHPRAAIIVDMVGDANLDIYMEQNSNAALMSEIWGQAAQLGFGQEFIPTVKYSMEDDHTPFLKAGIPAVDIIDFDYPYWHTAADTPDKVSPKSLEIVGETLSAWLMQQK